MKKFLIVILISFTMLISGCSNERLNNVYLDDNYRNYYEIFVGSFYDSNNDGIGDIKGVIEKLDYLNAGDKKTDNDLGVDGIWLMPIMPSPTYHKYDIKDYYSIDPQYGTMEDFQELIDKCNKRNIKLIIDLVLNHTSSEHPWFVSAKKSLAIEPCGQDECIYEELCMEHNKYVDYYNFSKEKLSGYHSYEMPEGWYYEGVFWDKMPDLNLDNEEVWNEIEGIVKFWIEKGIDGFRLDAVTSYYTGNITKNVEALKKINLLAKKYKDDVYIVGEAWADSGTIESYYESGINSFFNFPYGDSNGVISNTIRNKDGFSFSQKLEKWQSSLKKINKDFIDATFLSNHDMGRSAGFLMRDLRKEKMAASLYLMIPGNSFIYYGEEVGMTGSGVDENKRLPMVWSVNNKDENSLLNFYKKILSIKKENPEIARGHINAIDIGNDSICAYSCDYNGAKVYIVHNLLEEDLNINFSKEKYKYKKIVGSLETDDGKVELKGDVLTLPAMSTAIIK